VEIQQIVDGRAVEFQIEHQERLSDVDVVKSLIAGLHRNPWSPKMSTFSQDAHVQRLPDVMKRTGLARSSIYAAMAKGIFPAPIKLSARSIGFLSNEIDGWIADRAAARPASAANA